MNTHTCFICMGSNLDYATRLSNACLALQAHFPQIRFAEALETEAIGDKWLSPFGNQVGTFTTSLPAEEVRAIFKRIEKENGRTPEDKEKGIVKLDIDLLMYDGHILKPEDMTREHVIRGRNEIINQ